MVELKDYKLSEIKRICEEHIDQPCADCPFLNNFCDEREIWCGFTIKKGVEVFTPCQWEFDE